VPRAAPAGDGGPGDGVLSEVPRFVFVARGDDKQPFATRRHAGFGTINKYAQEVREIYARSGQLVGDRVDPRKAIPERFLSEAS
jgi:hypothetical protein